MTSHEHLQHLVELRGALLREVARLDVAICKESMRAQGGASPQGGDHHCRSGNLSWEAALRDAKVRPLHESVVMHA
jgi:hypothetical protein